MSLKGIGVVVAVEASQGTPATITGITKANPGVVTATAHGFDDGDIVVISISAGMVELDGQAVRVANKTNDTFETENLDTSAYSTYASGTNTAVDIATFTTVGKAQGVNMDSGGANELDGTVLTDTTIQTEYGMTPAAAGQITGLYDPTDGGIAIIKAASKTSTPKVFKITYPGGELKIFNANVAGGQGFNLQQGQLTTMSPIAISAKKDVLYYSS